jgi:predicted metal-dependent peptidase
VSGHGLDPARLAAARLWAATRFPYLASALFATRIVAVEQPGVFAVDEAWRVYMGPGVLDAWTTAQLGSVLVHHIGHLLRDHAGRARSLGLQAESAGRWTLAADAEINDDLDQAGLAFPTPPVTPEALGLEPGRFAEEYLRRLQVEPTTEDCGSGCDGGRRPWDQRAGEAGLGKDTAALLRCQVASEILRCCRGLEPGTVPRGLQRWAEEILGARVDWRRVLAAEVRRGLASVAGAVDYSYQRPSRRASVVPDVILPTMRRPVPELAVVVDTSGSMPEGLLGRALAEVDGILRLVGLGQRRVPVIACDAAVHSVRRVTNSRQVELLGGGGTNMGEGIEAARGLRPPPSMVVVLTDGFTPWPDRPPSGLRVLIGLLREGGRTPPDWARVVRIEADREAA